MILVIGHNSDWKKIYTLPRMVVGEVNRLYGLHHASCGKGANTLRALKAMGEEGFLLGYAGGNNGSCFVRYLNEEGLSCWMQTIQEETRTCITIIEESSVTELIEPSPLITEQEREAFLERFLKQIPDADLLVIVGTSLKGEDEDCYKRYIQEAGELGVPVILDSFRLHGRRALDAGPEVLKINVQELAVLTGKPVGTLAQRRKAYRDIRDRYSLEWIIITMGSNGLEGYDGNILFSVVPPSIELVNSVGSGDAVSAGIAMSMIHRYDLRQALIIGAALGTANCLSLIPGSVNSEDVWEIASRVMVEDLSG